MIDSKVTTYMDLIFVFTVNKNHSLTNMSQKNRKNLEWIP